LVPIKTIPNHSWDVSGAFLVIEKQWFCCSVSWSAESQPENGTNQAIRFSTALNAKTTLLHDIEPIGSHQNQPKSFMGCIKSICDD
jgi:hypothetical protein